MFSFGFLKSFEFSKCYCNLDPAGNYRRTAGKAGSMQSIALLETQPFASELRSELSALDTLCTNTLHFLHCMLAICDRHTLHLSWSTVTHKQNALAVCLTAAAR